MDYQAMWTPWSGPGLEHLRLGVDDEGVRADGLIIGVADAAPFRLRYSVRCDGAWRVREVRVTRLDLAVAPVALRADGRGHWTTPEGGPLPELDGCIDIDLSGSPFTNTLPIRRLRMPIGATHDLTMAYIQVPGLTVAPDRQRYTRLAADRYLYESGDSDFRAELPLDAAGLVLDYPGIARRVWPEARADSSIRLARPEDADAIAALVTAAYGHYVARIGRKPAPMSADYRALIAHDVVYILPGADGPRGLLVAYPDGDALFIENVAVSPREQGRGLGRALLDFAADLARTQGAVALTLYTNALMIENVHYYGKLGFVETARRTADGFDRIYMRKVLAMPPASP